MAFVATCTSKVPVSRTGPRSRAAPRCQPPTLFRCSVPLATRLGKGSLPIRPANVLPGRLAARAAIASPTSTKEGAASIPTKNGFHLHFGAGKLGLGLVFNALVESRVPFAIMQPPFPGDCDVLLEEETVSVIVNGEDRLPGGLTVITKENFNEKEELMASGRSLVLMHEGEEWDKLIKKATSFSTSIGPKVSDVIAPRLVNGRDKVPLEMRPKLFACENDHNAVENLKELLKGRIEVIPCIVDRICSDRVVEGGAFKVTTEPWGGTLVPLTPLPEEDEDAPIPLGGSNVFVPRTEKESNYMYDRKIMTVNHMHTTLAFLTLVRHMDRTGATPDDMVAGNMACKSLPLIKFDPKVDPKVSQIWCWGVAQCLLLQSEHDKHTMMKAHKVDNMDDLNSEVLKTVKENLYRFGAVEDSTARVLGAGVDRRYQGRLLPAYEAVQVLQGAMSEWGEENRYQKLLDMAGVTIEDVVEACRYLVTAAGPIAEADRRKHEREKAEAEPFYLRVLSKIKDGLEAVSHTATMDSNLSGEISDWLPRFDLGLEWVACRLEELGFRNLQDLDHSLQKSFSEEATPDFLRSSMDEQKHESK